MSETVQNSLPNPFSNSADVVMPSADTAAAAVTPSLPTAAAVPIAEPENRFVLDEAAFMAELADETVREALKQQMPAFLRAPSPEFLQATGGE